MNNLGSFQAKGDIGQIERIQRREIRFNSGNYSSSEEDATRRLKLKVGSFSFSKRSEYDNSIKPGSCLVTRF
jgi:hypothetical protein